MFLFQGDKRKNESSLFSFLNASRDYGCEGILTQGFHIGNPTRKGGVIRGVTIGSYTGNEPVCRGYEVNEHFFLLSFVF